MDDAKVIEPVAQAIFDAVPYAGSPGRPIPEKVKPYYNEMAVAAITAHKAALAEAGYVIVPMEPTTEMVAAAERNFFEHMPDAREWTMTHAKDALRDGIAAAPKRL